MYKNIDNISYISYSKCINDASDQIMANQPEQAKAEWPLGTNLY